MSLPVEYPAVEIAPAPIKAPAVDRAAAAARVTAALELAARLNEHAKSTPAVAANASGVEAGVADRATALADLLKRGAYDEELTAALARLDDVETAAREILQRVSFADHDQRALESPYDTLRLQPPVEPL